MSKNNLYTLGYFRSRLLKADISSKILLNEFKKDSRYWMISIDDDYRIVCTCFKTEADFYFEFFDGGNRIKNNRIIKTDSMNIIIDYIKGILNG